MKSGLSAAAIIMIVFCAVAVHGSANAPAPKRTSASAMQPKNFSTPRTAVSPANPSAARVINTQTLTITGANTGSQLFTPKTIHTAILTITGSSASSAKAFSSVNIKTKPLTITGN